MGYLSQNLHQIVVVVWAKFKPNNRSYLSQIWSCYMSQNLEQITEVIRAKIWVKITVIIWAKIWTNNRSYLNQKMDEKQAVIWAKIAVSII